jgi:RNA polymerase sigma-70 factor, ECF subfamily
MEIGSGISSLASRARAGDSVALNELLAELRPLIVQVVRLVVGSGSWTAEDAAQEALLDVSQGINGLRDPAAVRTWALRVATRRALKVARRERVPPFRRGLSIDALEATTPADERRAALKQAFDRLPARLRVTAVLRLQAGLSERETAEALGCAVGTVKSNLHDARKRLTQMLAEADYAPTVKQRKESSHDHS